MHISRRGFLAAAVPFGMRGEDLVWRELPALPRGLAGQFVGAIGGMLIVAGGTWWEGKPWSGGKKFWSDKVYGLRAGDPGWRNLGTLPRPLAYGAAVSTKGRVLLVGGQTDSSVSSQLIELTLGGLGIRIRELHRMPLPTAWCCAGVIGDRLYVAGGGDGFPSANQAYRTFWSYNLRNPAEEWREVDTWNGSPRFLAAMAVVGDSLVLGGGTDFGGGQRIFRNDAFAFHPKAGWKRIADLPVSLQGGVAGVIRGKATFFGGNDGAWVDRESDPAHPGFRREVYSYDATGNVWSQIGVMPASLVTTGMTQWDGGMVIAGGEDKPGSRSGRVLKVY
jgi:N-acetylneuraminic acid mutarotase